MDNSTQPPVLENNNNTLPPALTSSPVINTPQVSVAPQPPKNKSKRLVIIVVAILLIAGLAAGLWFVLVKDKEPSNSANTQTQNQSSQTTLNSSQCAYVPKQNFKENEGLYSIWRENAKKVDFDVYLPCNFHKNFVLHELGIAGGDSDEVVNVFLTFNRPEPTDGEDGLPDDSNFHIRALPAQHQPPSKCIDMFSTTSSNVRTGACEKAGDSKFGIVYKNSQGDLYLVINNSLIIWSYPPYDDSGDVKPMLEILNSLQKVDPAKLEFFNG